MRTDIIEYLQKEVYHRCKQPTNKFGMGCYYPVSYTHLGYVVTLDGETYFVTGDTDANEDNIDVQCDILLVPCGGKYTFDIKEACLLYTSWSWASRRNLSSVSHSRDRDLVSVVSVR